MAEIVTVSLVTPAVGAPPPDGVLAAGAPGAAPEPPVPARAAPPATGAPPADAPAACCAPPEAAGVAGPPGAVSPVALPAAPACSPVARPAALKPWRGVLTEQATMARPAVAPRTAATQRRPAHEEKFALARARASIGLISAHSPAAGLLPAVPGPISDGVSDSR